MSRPKKTFPVDQAKQMYESGATLLEIAAEFETSPQTARRRLAEAGVLLRGKTKTERSKQKLRAYRDYESIPLRELSEAGHTTAEIAKMYEKDEESVRRAMQARGIPRQAPKARREHNAFWRGGYAVDRNGYILVHSPGHPHRNKSNYVRQHRLAMEKDLGRYLLPTEVVDHVNGDTSDNRIENLRLFASNAEHLRETLKGRVRLTSEEREHQRQAAVLRAQQRVDAILAQS